MRGATGKAGMAMLRLGGTIAALMALTLSGGAHAAPLSDAPVDDAPRRYLMMLPETPVSEIAEEVLGETLGLPVTTDETVDAAMPFRIDGQYTPRQLARELGYRLWNVDVALIEEADGDLKLIPASALAAAVAAGGEVVAPLAVAAPASAQAQPMNARTPIVYGQDRFRLRDLAMAALGWLGGAASFGAVIAVRRRRRPQRAQGPVALLPAPRSPAAEIKTDAFSIPDRAA